jgi:hypothetical protein
MQQTMNQQRQWAKVQAVVSQITDALGKPVDPGIADTLTALLVHGFPTEGSCEGHLDHGVKAPWVDIGKNLPAHYIALFEKEGLPHKPGKPPHVDDVFVMYPDLDRLRERNLRMQARLRLLLRAFYRTHHVQACEQLVMIEKGCYGVVRLINQGADHQEARTPRQQAEMLHCYQQEIQTFAAFLKKRYCQDKLQPDTHVSTATSLSAIT